VAGEPADAGPVKIEDYVKKPGGFFMKRLAGLLVLLLTVAAGIFAFAPAETPALSEKEKIDLLTASRDLGFAQSDYLQAKDAMEQKQKVMEERNATFQALLKKLDSKPGFKLNPGKLIYEEVKPAK
jgi:hypothetical protein